MAITYVGTAHTQSAYGAVGTVFTLGRPTLGTNDILIVQAHALRAGVNVYRTPSSITFDSTELTHIGVASGGVAGGGGTSFYYLINPTGAGVITFTYAAPVYDFAGDAMIFSGIHQVTPIGEVGTDSRSVASSDDLEVILTDLSTNSWVFGGSGVAKNNTAVATTVDGSSVYNYAYSASATFKQSIAGSYNSSLGGAGTDTATHSFNQTCTGGIVAFELRATDSAFQQGVSEAVNITESATTQHLAKKTISEPVDITESTVSAQFYLRSISENATVADTISRVTNKMVTEAVKITQTVATKFVKTINEAIKVTQTVFTSFIHDQDVLESIQVTETIKKYINGFPIGIWTKIAKKTATWTATAKESVTWTKIAKIAASWTASEKLTTAWTIIAKKTATWTKTPKNE